MLDLADFDAARRAAQNPATTGADLSVIAKWHPDLRCLVAAHPNTYPALLDWLRQFGDAEVNQIVALRQSNSGQPSATPAAQTAPPVATPVIALPNLTPQQLAQASPFQQLTFDATGPIPKIPYQPLAFDATGPIPRIPAAGPFPSQADMAAAAMNPSLDPGPITGPIPRIPVQFVPIGPVPMPSAWPQQPQPVTGYWATAPVQPTWTTPPSQMPYQINKGQVPHPHRGTWIAVISIVVVLALMVAGFFIFIKPNLNAPGLTPGPLGSPSVDANSQPAVPVTPGGKAYGGSQDDVFYSTATTSNNSIVAVGYTASLDGDFPGRSNNRNALIVKFNADGTTAWSHVFDGDRNNAFYCVALASDGGFIAAGYTSAATGDFPASHGSQDALLVKINPDGTLAWAKTFGGTDADVFTGVAAAPNGNIAASGSTYSTDGDFGANRHSNDQDAVAALFTSTGDLQSVQVLGGSGDDVFTSVAVAPNGEVVFGGATASTDGDFPAMHGGMDAVVVTMAWDGTVNSATTYGGSGDDQFAAIAVTASGNTVAAGYTMSPNGDFPTTGSGQSALVVTINPDGNITWAKTIGSTGLSRFTALALASDGSIVAAGSSTASVGFDGWHGQSDAVMASITPLGTVNWAKAYGGSRDDEFLGCALTQDGSIVAVGDASSPDGDFSVTHGTDTVDAVIITVNANNGA